MKGRHEFTRGDLIRHRYSGEMYLVLEDEEDLITGCLVLHTASGRITSVFPEMFVLITGITPETTVSSTQR